jgi:hypothetical protein
VLGTAAISWTRRATWALKAATPARNKNQKARVATRQLQDCRIAELQEGKEEVLPPSLSAILQSCNPAILTL